MDAMKMQHEIRSPARGYVRRIAVEAGETIYEGHALLFVEEADVEVKGAVVEEKIDLDYIRPDLAEYFERRAMTLDDKRPDAVARRRKTNQRTARQNLDDLVDPGSFVEWGAFAIASQRTRRTQEDLIEKTPADGLITGIGRVNGSLFGPEKSRVAIAHYDYTVLAGTQGKTNHHKKDRLFEIVEEQRLPLVFFTEGGGGRPGDVDVQSVAGLNTMAFHIFGRLSGVLAAGRHQFRALLRRQCRDPGLLRRGDRHEELVDRHGRAGDDRGRQSRRVRARGSGPDERAGAQRHGRHRRRGRGRGGGRRQEVPVVLPGRAAGMAGGRPAAAAPRHPREPAARLRRARCHRDACATRARCSSCAAPSGSAW